MNAILKRTTTIMCVLSLGACATGSSVNVAPDVTSFENGVIADVEAACAVEPTLASIAALFPVYGGAVAAAANAVCAAVNAVPAPKVASLSMGASATGAAVRHGFPSVTVHGHVINFQ